MLVIDHAAKPAEKVRISGGGRCNFTNIHTTSQNFISENPHFAKSALARYTPWDFCDLAARHNLTWTEKTLGQLFCEQRSGAVIQMLLDELATVSGELKLETEIISVAPTDSGYRVETASDTFEAQSLVVATGGLSIPKMGASSFAYDLARQFGHDIVPVRPALVPFTFSGVLKDQFAELSGVSCPVDAKAGTGPGFQEAMLFTHRGLSGPAMLQVSAYWHESEAIEIDLAPGWSVRDALADARTASPKMALSTWLASVLPSRFAHYAADWKGVPAAKTLASLSNNDMDAVETALKHWRIIPTGTEGWRTAEVTAGGVSTAGLSSKTMESQHSPNLYFIGECVDVTGWLGGYNFQWAWASAAACAEAIAAHQ